MKTAVTYIYKYMCHIYMCVYMCMYIYISKESFILGHCCRTERLNQLS